MPFVNIGLSIAMVALVLTALSLLLGTLATAPGYIAAHLI